MIRGAGRTCFRTRSKMKRRAAENTCQICSKSSKIASKLLPGDLWASLGRRPCFQSRPGDALGRPGVPQKVVVGGQGASWGEKLIDFTLLGAPWEGPGRALGGHFRSFFAVGPAGTEKIRNINIVCIFWGGCIFKVFCLFLVRLTGGARGSAP